MKLNCCYIVLNVFYIYRNFYLFMKSAHFIEDNILLSLSVNFLKI